MSPFRQGPFALLLAAGLGLTTGGCSTAMFSRSLFTNLNLTPEVLNGFHTEQRVIQQFTDARAEDNEAAFRRIVSTRFEQKALRAPEAYKDLDILNLPKVTLEVMEVTKNDDGVLEVVAREEDGARYQFRLLRDPVKRRLVVDDVLLRQQKKGTRASKSASEVMDLLLTVREFLEIWKNDDPNAVLQVVSNDLKESLRTLPEPWLRSLMRRLTDEYETGMARRPEAQMNESDAVVKMPAKNGFLLMKVVHEGDGWLVSDVEVRNRRSDEHPGSLLRQARALNVVSGFLRVWQSRDPAGLEPYSSPAFFNSALKVADLSQVALPSPAQVPEDFEIRSFPEHLTVILPQPGEVVRISLEAADQAGSAGLRSKSETDVVESRFLVSDITLYDRASQRQTRLLSAFTAPARAQLFLTALQTGDLPMLRQLSSAAFGSEVWNDIPPELFAALNLQDVPAGEVTLQDSRIRGDRTELELLTRDGRLCSVSMIEENGTLKVDDLQYPDQSLSISSLKTRLALAVPVTGLAGAWAEGNLAAVSGYCSGNFNRLVWSNVRMLPAGFDQLAGWLQMPVQQVSADDLHGQMRLSSPGQSVVEIRLVRENMRWKIDEIHLQRPDGSRCELRQTLRQEIAQTILQQPAGGIQQLGYQPDSIPGDSGVKHAGAEVTALRGNLTIPSTRAPVRKSRPAPVAANTSISSGRADDRSAPIRPDADGTFRFGPDADSLKAVAEEPPADDLKTTTDASRPPSGHATEPVEVDGVMYFPNAGPPAQAPRDFSERPIAIPRE